MHLKYFDKKFDAFYLIYRVCNSLLLVQLNQRVTPHRLEPQGQINLFCFADKYGLINKKISLAQRASQTKHTVQQEKVS